MKSKSIAYFNSRLDSFKAHYDPSRLFAKLEKTARKIGQKAAYAILVLYYSLLGSDVSIKEKAMIVAALGYFILPADFLPDIMGLLGFSDDFTVIWYVFRRIRKNIKADVKQKAHERLRKWFPDSNEATTPATYFYDDLDMEPKK